MDVCVIGAGPAGSVVAARAAQLGFRVGIVERASFPRRHLGESLTPGVVPMLESFGAGQVLAAAESVPVQGVMTTWHGALTLREAGRAAGVLVDRAAFDAELLNHALSCGVHRWQPAVVGARASHEHGWTLRIDSPQRSDTVQARLLVDATGRSATLSGARRRVGPRTMALYAYWRGGRLPARPRIEAGRDAWYWGVPLPDGSYNTLAFVDGNTLGDRLRASPRSPSASPLQRYFQELLSRSGLMDDCDGAEQVGSVRAADATPYVDDACVTRTSLKVGDAALAIDPLSSSGVQKAIQTALAGALVINTLLRKPERLALATSFYGELLRSASAMHASWASQHYASVASRESDTFWVDRARGASAPVETDAPRYAAREALAARLSSTHPVALSAALELAELPQLGPEFVERGLGIRHPALDVPVAFVGGVEIAPLLREFAPGRTPMQLARSWTPRVPLETGIALTAWLLKHGVLVDSNGPVGAGGSA